MRHIALLALALCAPLLVRATEPTDAVAIARSVGEAFGAACRAGDVEAALALYADDASAIFPGQGAEAKGKEAIRRMLASEVAALSTSAPTQLTADAHRIDDTHIVNVGRWEITVPGPGGRKTKTIVRTSEVLVRQDGSWRYLVDHASVGLPPAPPPSRRRARR